MTTGMKHYVYSARTTEKGLAILNKAKGDRSWDAFIAEAVAAHYSLDLAKVALPPSKFLADQSAKREKRDADRAKAKAAREAKAKEKAAAKKAAEKKGAKKPANVTKAGKATAPKQSEQETETVDVTVRPGETKVVGHTSVTAPADNSGPVTVPVEVKKTVRKNGK